MTVFALTAVAIGLIMLVMALGALLNSRCLTGSCGRREILDGEGQPLTCVGCPRGKVDGNNANSKLETGVERYQRPSAS